MGIFDFLKGNKDDKSGPTTDGAKIVMVDNIYLLSVPKDWTQYESDRFRMKTTSESIQFSASNYAKSIETVPSYSIIELKPEVLALFDNFEKEGGYIPLNDQLIGEDFVYQAFKVDEETQYYFQTFRKVKDSLIRINFILREIGEYNTETRSTMLSIGKSILVKVANLK